MQVLVESYEGGQDVRAEAGMGGEGGIALRVAGKAEAGDGGQKHRVREPMRDVEERPEGARHTMDESDARVRKGHAAEGGAGHHGFLGGEVLRVRVGPAEMGHDEPSGFEGDRIGEGAGLAGDIGLKGMGERIEADSGGEGGGRREGELVID